VAQNDVKKIDDSPYREALFVLKGDTVSRVDVVVGIQDENYIEIKSGVSEGEEVVIGPYVALSRKLKNGSKVHRKVDEKKKE